MYEQVFVGLRCQPLARLKSNVILSPDDLTLIMQVILNIISIKPYQMAGVVGAVGKISTF